MVELNHGTSAVIRRILQTSDYDAAYFGDTAESGGFKNIAGYSHYLEKAGEKTRADEGNFNKPYNIKREGLKKSFEAFGLENSSITQLGGGCGHLGALMIEEGFTWHVVDASNWCFRHKVIPDINFTESTALDYLALQGNNSLDVIMTTRFLVCLSDPDIQILIDEMRRTTRNQVHFVDERPNPAWYSARTLEQWRDTFSWPNNSITLVSIETGRVISF